MKIFSAQQIHALELHSMKVQNCSSLELMERAATQIFMILHQRLQGAQLPIHIFCGLGKNGGDGMVLARLLEENGYNVMSYVVNFSDTRGEEFLANFDRFKAIAKKWPEQLKSSKDFPDITAKDLVIDAIFGLGFNRPMVPWVADLVKHINGSQAYVIAIDVPSGLYADKKPDNPDTVIYANITLTFQLPKMVFFLPETAIYSQDIEVLDIGLDATMITESMPFAKLVHRLDILEMYQPREKFTHKGTYGHCLLISGSYGKIGSTVLASKASLVVGAGLVTSHIPKCGYTILQTALPEAMVQTDSHEMLVTKIDLHFEPNVACIGPGLGNNKETVAGITAFLESYKGRLVVDADGLNIVSENPTLLKLLPENVVLTPHKKELERLIGAWNDDFDKIEKAKGYSKKHQCILVVKGAITLIIQSENVYVNTTGNPGMATAGAGDVLAGMITGLIAQKYEPLQAAIMGVYLHASAGDLAVQEKSYQGLLASDIITSIGKAYIALFKQEQPVQEEQQQTASQSQ